MRGINHAEDFSWSNAPRFGGGGGTTTQTGTSSTAPWANQQPFLMEGFGQAANLYDNPANWPQYYPGSTYVPLGTSQLTSLQQLQGIGLNQTPALNSAEKASSWVTSPQYLAQTQQPFNQSNEVLSNEMSPGYLNPWNSGSFGTVVNNTIASVLPSITSSFIGGNRSDSGLATQAASQGLANAVGGLAQNQYNTNQQIQQNAVAQAANNYMTQQGNQVKTIAEAPFIDQSVVSDVNSGLQAGNQIQQDAQNARNADIQHWNFNQQLPWNMLSQFQNATGGNYGGTTTGTQTQPYYSSTGANVATGVGAAASVAASIAAII